MLVEENNIHKVHVIFLKGSNYLFHCVSLLTSLPLEEIMGL